MLAALTALNVPATAQGVPPTLPSRPAIHPDAMKYAGAFHLAYVRSSSAVVNDVARYGLEALAQTLREKTAAIPKGVAGVNIEQDEISFFPFIYWPVSASTPILSEKAQIKVQNYINSGGVILFDMAIASGNTKAVSRILGNVTMRPLIRVTNDHTLMHSFYLVSGLPGSNRNNNIWVESPGVKGRNYASSVIVGENHWAEAWMVRPLSADPDEREAQIRTRDMALRSGVNIVMFALTGNYADDQIQLPALREKRGQPPQP